MFGRIKFLLKYYGALVALFALTKPCFLMAAGRYNVGDWLAVIWHGLPLDIATAGYLAALIWLVMLVTIWVNVPRIRLLYNIWCGLVAALCALASVSNICLYGFWGFPLDGTVFNYLDSPGGAAASVSGGYIAAVVLTFIVCVVAIFYWLRLCWTNVEAKTIKRWAQTGLFVVAGGLMFLGIRGGVGKSTANVGMVYFSSDQTLNHAAVNPIFSVVSSLTKNKDFAKMHDVYDEARRSRIFQSLGYNTATTAPDSLLSERRPNVLIILMEGCGGTFVHAIDSLADARVTPHLNRLADEGVCFTQCYANSFRTDRGTVCALSGYPAFPDVSVMKLPSKAAALPGIAHSLKKAGYSTDFLYGGDINFTGTNGYLLATGYEKTYGDTSFSYAERQTHNWGVADHIVFGRLLEMIKAKPKDRPWHTALLTLASHEPWGVPYDRIKGDKVANAMAYLDHSLGQFIEAFKKLPQWHNTLVVILPDHGIAYPEGLRETDLRRSHIPMIWTGGAIKEPRRIDQICNQSDLPATLLGQLSLPHDDFKWSRDVLSQTYTRPSAVHAWPEGIWWLDQTGFTAINILTKPASILADTPTPSAERQQAAHAFLQTAYDDLGALGR